MTIDAIKNAKATHPFKPFTLGMPDGGRKVVTRPEQIGMTADGSTTVYFDDEGGGFYILDTASITEIAFPDLSRI